MKPSIQTLSQILYSPSQYIIPVFQRNYRWEKPQWEKLWHSLLEIQSPLKKGNHFMGFLVFVPGLAQPGQHTRFHLIDGQQRLTTSSILMVAIRNVARTVGQNELADEIHNFFLVHPIKKGDQHLRLLPKEHDHDNYRSIVLNNGQSFGRIASALDYFEQKIGEIANDGPDELSNIKNICLQRLEFMCATLEAENAYNIFKSLNSTGVPLGSSDLIRNFVFMHVPPDEQDEFDTEYWANLEARFSNAVGQLEESRFSRFFRDFMMRDGRYVSPKEVFSTFEERYESTDFSPKQLATELLVGAKNYSIINGDEQDEDIDVTNALKSLNALDSSTTYPLLMALFKRRSDGVISSIQLTKCIKMLSGFILRRLICGLNSRSYGQSFVRALAKDRGDCVQALEQFLLEKEWPDDSRFESAFITHPIYRGNYTKVVLETLERNRGHKEVVDLSSAQIEHIMPQTLNNAWRTALGPNAERIQAEHLHYPGNLTLSAYNQELGNQSFDNKKQRFKLSNISLTKELSNYSIWDAKAIIDRGKALASEAINIWIGPKYPYIAPTIHNVDKDDIDRENLRFRFWSGLAEYIAERDESFPLFEPRHHQMVRMPSVLNSVTIDMRHIIQNPHVSIEIGFGKDKYLPIWESLQSKSSELNQLTYANWIFKKKDNKVSTLHISHSCAAFDESKWHEIYDWLYLKMGYIYKNIIPLIKSEIHALSFNEETTPELDNDEYLEEEAGNLTLTKRYQLELWESLIDEFARSAPDIKASKARAQHYLNFFIGVTGFGFATTVNTRNDRIAAELYIDHPESKRMFNTLQLQKEYIHSKLGFLMEWNELPNKHACRIIIYKNNCPLSDKNRWHEYNSWFVQHIVSIYKVFKPLVQNI